MKVLIYVAGQNFPSAFKLWIFRAVFVMFWFWFYFITLNTDRMSLTSVWIGCQGYPSTLLSSLFKVCCSVQGNFSISQLFIICYLYLARTWFTPPTSSSRSWSTCPRTSTSSSLRKPKRNQQRFLV